MFNGHFFLLHLVGHNTTQEAVGPGMEGDESGSAGTWCCSQDFGVLL